HAGLDIGSTTAKLVLVDATDQLIFSRYQRHYARILDTVSQFFSDILTDLGNCRLHISVTGSAGMGFAQMMTLPFAQEVVCTHEVVRQIYPLARTVIDIGGEDSKMIFLSLHRPPDIRMNGNCAGGTGAFIDQLAGLLNRSPDDLNRLAERHTRLYPIASRCGVFAKTDVQNLLSRNVPVEDIAASVFHAVAIQCLNTLSRGSDITPKLLLCGGVFSFLPELVKVFLSVLGLSASDRIIPDHPALLPAMGAAMFSRRHDTAFAVQHLLDAMAHEQELPHENENRLDPLFHTGKERMLWKQTRQQMVVPRMDLSNYTDRLCFLGIDSGSTTTKIVALDVDNQVLFSWYKNNGGNPIQAVIQGLDVLYSNICSLHPGLAIARTIVTGYGEDLIQTAFGM
ncbi:MAG: acyl-CoA dehydratase activase, partial [Desulfobacteraceae bacterium]|nr:acyl-CoA dehydratase activase [Desulfobacteraceae bacterium]